MTPMLNVATRRLIWADRSVKLSPARVVILQSCALARGTFISQTRLMRDLWGDPTNEPAAAESSLKVQIHGLRRQLSGFPVSIVNRYGGSYACEGDVTIIHSTVTLLNSSDVAIIGRLLRTHHNRQEAAGAFEILMAGSVGE